MTSQHRSNFWSSKSLPGKHWSGHISATDHPTHFRSGSIVWFLNISELSNLTSLLIFTPQLTLVVIATKFEIKWVISRLVVSWLWSSLDTAHCPVQCTGLMCLSWLVCLQAVCCSDKQHCCPSGYTCDVSAGTCSQHSLSMSWNALAVRQSFQASSNDVVCPDEAECPDGDTCCQMTSGQYGCCPFPKVLHAIHFVCKALSDSAMFCWFVKYSFLLQAFHKFNP